MGIAGVKIVGRDNARRKKIKDVTFIRQLLTVLREQQPDKKVFVNIPETLPGTV